MGEELKLEGRRQVPPLQSGGGGPRSGGGGAGAVLCL